MFDVKQEINLKIPGPEGKRVPVRFPTDEEFTDWRRKKKIQQRDLGRRSFTLESSKPEVCDLELYKKIRVDTEESPAPPLPEDQDEAMAEASYVLSTLQSCDVRERPERNGSEFAIRMRVMGKLSTEHILAIPSMKQMMDYERARSSVTFGQYGTQEIKINVRAAGELYDKLKRRSEGYAGAVPIAHKAEAINVLLQELRAEQDEDSGDEDDDEG